MFWVYEAGNGHGNSVPPRGTNVGGVGCPWTAHLLYLYEMDYKCPCVLALELFDVSDLS